MNWVDPCPTCPRKYRAIGGDGPRPAPVLAVMERPGKDENAQGRVACGKTGQELDELYLPLAGLDRSEIRVVNSVLCWADSNKTPTDKEIQSCAAHHLRDEIEKTNPSVILLLGSTPCSLVSGIRLELHHGIPQHTSKVGDLLGWEGWLVPMYHPAIGLHESRWMQICMEDWQRLHFYNNPRGFENDPPSESVCYKHVQGESAVTEYFRQAYTDDDVVPAMDTEQHGGRAWSIQVSVKPHTGILIRADDRAGLEALDFWFNSSFMEWDIAMHHAAHDLEWARRMKVQILRYRDTLQEAFHLGNLPQGLKELSYRLFRHTMTSFKETVTPASIRALQDWMLEAYCIAQNDLSFVTKRFHKTTGKPLKDEVKGSELEEMLKRLLSHTSTDSDYDPWDRKKDDDAPRLNDFWNDPLNEWMRDHVEARIGHYPILGIANCSMDEAVRYAVGDADYTGRVAIELARRREGAFQIYQGDQDV